MLNAQKLDEIAQQIDAMLPEGVKNISSDLQNGLKQTVVQVLSKLDLVTREEFDIQTKVLQKTREKISELEELVKNLEEEIKRRQ